ncbi:hypothetical protein HRR83_007901 [Exophiala dermatitidis]|uniref:Uncharacterized protein n=1 Tax=Exophiala dermatitidis TaxID=5970 RepID=A0AAN6IUB8_EXODE|nr:hypothetical protein HRR74_007444 [Exophiala dermatitidis]KAJ4510104.1 hypothetical protein HRR73_006902 [Exophiala dermatitidis]KAJ4539107.1 hypothetical protein HRR77_006523 [Exophiala dermatitidis]KAJ4540612.1 hypothetical protein HRR76_003999 [Exophiala dermatitidis]KAJ4564555.1 hypothetical protein HRR79_005815 [Exophiala dermatitidis]
MTAVYQHLVNNRVQPSTTAPINATLQPFSFRKAFPLRLSFDSNINICYGLYSVIRRKTKTCSFETLQTSLRHVIPRKFCLPFAAAGANPPMQADMIMYMERRAYLRVLGNWPAKGTSFVPQAILRTPSR